MNTKFQEHHEIEAVLAIKDMFEELGWLFTIHYPPQVAAEMIGDKCELFVFHNRNSETQEPLEIVVNGKIVPLTVVNHKLDGTGMYKDPFMFASGQHKVDSYPKPETITTPLSEVYGWEVPADRFPEPKEVKTTLGEVYGIAVPANRFHHTEVGTALGEVYGIDVPKERFGGEPIQKSKTPSTTLWEVYGGLP
jgi:hypothetical protein